jgi:predicted transcriptional regulator
MKGLNSMKNESIEYGLAFITSLEGIASSLTNSKLDIILDILKDDNTAVFELGEAAGLITRVKDKIKNALESEGELKDMSNVNNTTTTEKNETPFGMRSLVSAGLPEFLGKYIKEKAVKAAEENPDDSLIQEFVERYVNNENPLAENGIYRVGYATSKEGNEFIYAKRLAPLNKSRLNEFRKLKDYDTFTEDQYNDFLRNVVVSGTGAEIAENMYGWLNAYLLVDEPTEEEVEKCDMIINFVNRMIFGNRPIDESRKYTLVATYDEDDSSHITSIRISFPNSGASDKRGGNRNNKGGKKFNKRK